MAEQNVEGEEGRMGEECKKAKGAKLGRMWRRCWRIRWRRKTGIARMRRLRRRRGRGNEDEVESEGDKVEKAGEAGENEVSLTEE